MKTRRRRRVTRQDNAILLFDEAVKAFVWMTKKDPRASEIVRYIGKLNLTKRFSPPELFTLAFDFSSISTVFIDRLVAKGRSLDRNFEKNVMRFRKKSGMDDGKLSRDIKKRIKEAVSKEISNNPVSFVSHGPTRIIASPLNEKKRRRLIHGLRGKYRDILVSGEQFIKDKDKEIELEK